MTDEELIAKMRGADPWTAPYFANEALSFAADRIEALLAVTVGVKPLVWEEDKDADSEDFGAFVARSPTLHLRYIVYRVYGGEWKLTGSVPFGQPNFPTLEAAKAAAQRDYTARILAALEPAAPDPAAIREAAIIECANAIWHGPIRDYGSAAQGHELTAAHKCRDTILALIAKGAADD